MLRPADPRHPVPLDPALPDPLPRPETPPEERPVIVEPHETPREIDQVAVVPSIRSAARRELRVYSHSMLIYWWPVWVVGYAMAILTRMNGQSYEVGDGIARIHSSSNVGVVFFLTLFLVIVVTNVSVRGLASALVITVAAFLTVLFALLGWWDSIFQWFGELQIHLNFGAYFWFSTLMLVLWVVSVFVIDRMSYWHFRPGQVSREYAFGAGSRSYDTNGMVLEKHREDIFRHWLLGLGTGDLQIGTSGAADESISVPNVTFIGSKIETMQRLIAEEPESH